MAKIIIELIPEGDAEDALNHVGNCLDVGNIQDAITDDEGEIVKFKSAVCSFEADEGTHREPYRYFTLWANAEIVDSFSTRDEARRAGLELLRTRPGASVCLQSPDRDDEAVTADSEKPNTGTMHTRDLDCIAAGQVDEETGECHACGVSGGDPCHVCGDIRFHRPNCPESDVRGQVGGCGSCRLGVVLTNGGNIQACDECARAGRGFAFIDQGNLCPDDAFAARFAFRCIEAVEGVRFALYKDGTDTNWSPDTIDAVSDEVAFAAPERA